MKTIGFFQDASGERSSTKLINFIVACSVLLMWIVVSILKQEVIELPETALYMLGMSIAGSGIKQLIDGAFPGKKIEIIRRVLKVK